MKNFKFTVEGIDIESRGELPEAELEVIELGGKQYVGKRWFKSWKTTVVLAVGNEPFTVNYTDERPDVILNIDEPDSRISLVLRNVSRIIYHKETAEMAIIYQYFEVIKW